MEIQEVTLGEISTITMGTSPKGETYNYEGVGMPLLNGPTEFGLIHPKCTLFTTDSKKDSKKGDLIFCVRGSTTGRMNWADMPYSLGRGVCSIRGATPMDTKYIKYYLENKLDALLKLSGGATFPNLTGNDFATFPIHYQKNRHKIAAILSAYDDLIESNTRRIRILEEMAQALYREWFVKFRFPRHEKVKMVESEMGMVPEGWEVRRLGDIAKETRRSVQPEKIKPETPYIGLQHIPRKSIALAEWGMASEVKSTKLSFKSGEILFGKIRPYFHKVGVAPLDGVCSSDTIVISPKDSDYFSIVLACVSSEEFVNHATQTSQGTKMPRANWKLLIKYPVVIPPLTLLIRFDEFIKNVTNQIQNMIFRNRNLSSTRDLLLPKLISSKVKVEKVGIGIREN